MSPAPGIALPAAGCSSMHRARAPAQTLTRTAPHAPCTRAQDIEATKKEVQDQLKVLREENDEAMFEFRANRKLGVQLRDLVAEGKLEEAQKMAEEQVGCHRAPQAAQCVCGGLTLAPSKNQAALFKAGEGVHFAWTVSGQAWSAGSG